MKYFQIYKFNTTNLLSFYEQFLKVINLPGLLLIFSFSCLSVQAAASDIYVVDTTVGVLRLDSVTGIRSVISDFNNVNQGELGSIPFNLALESSGTVLVVDPGVNKLFRVNIGTGQRTVVSDFNNAAQGPIADSAAGNGIAGISVEATGGILMTAVGAGSPDPGSTAYRIALLRVNPVSGQRTLLSDFGNPNQGTLGGQCSLGIAVETTGKILVTDCNNLSGSSSGLLFRIDPATGQRTVVSDFGNSNQGETVQFPHGIAVDSTGKILVVAPFFGGIPGGALFKIDPESGNRVLLSDFSDSTLGATGTLLRSVAVESNGNILVADQDVDDFGSGGAVFRVNPSTGQRTVLSNFADIALGPGRAPTGVVLKSFPTITAFAAFNSQLVLSRTKTGFLLGKGTFTLGSDSDGIFPVHEPVTFSLTDQNGAVFKQTVPQQSFKAMGKGAFIYNSKYGTAGINTMLIRPTGTNKQYFYSVYIGEQDFRSADKPPVKVTLTAGSDSGSNSLLCKAYLKILICR